MRRLGNDVPVLHGWAGNAGGASDSGIHRSDSALSA